MTLLCMKIVQFLMRIIIIPLYILKNINILNMLLQMEFASILKPVLKNLSI